MKNAPFPAIECTVALDVFVVVYRVLCAKLVVKISSDGFLVIQRFYDLALHSTRRNA